MSLAPGPLTGRPDATDRSRTGNVFDPSLAEHPLRTVRVDDVIDLLHVSHWPERVSEYHHAMQAGHRFPPIAIVYLGGRPFLADGHKRFQAYLRLQRTDIVVQVWPLQRWLADQYGQLRRSLSRWSIAVRGLRDPTRRQILVVAAAQSTDHWKRILRSLTKRRSGIAGGKTGGETRQLGR